jgi:hypothetical protein
MNSIMEPKVELLFKYILFLLVIDLLIFLAGYLIQPIADYVFWTGVILGIIVVVRISYLRGMGKI